MLCTALEAQQAGEEALLTETTCGGKRNNRRREKGIADAGRTDLPGLTSLWWKVRCCSTTEQCPIQAWRGSAHAESLLTSSHSSRAVTPGEPAAAHTVFDELRPGGQIAREQPRLHAQCLQRVDQRAREPATPQLISQAVCPRGMLVVAVQKHHAHGIQLAEKTALVWRGFIPVAQHEACPIHLCHLDRRGCPGCSGGRFHFLFRLRQIGWV